jgi:competence protein ComEC
MLLRASTLTALIAWAACGSAPAPALQSTPGPAPADEPPPPLTANEPPHAPPAPCGGAQLRVAFYSAGQGLAALVTLPEGRHILVDTGESPSRPGCGAPCKEWHRRVMAGLARDLGGAPIDLLWLTHPHSDHIGGVVDVVAQFRVVSYVDNGRDLTGAMVTRARDAAQAHHVPIAVIEPGSTAVPLASSVDVHLVAIVPRAWSAQCRRNANACSILLRVDYCSSSILFTGDAEGAEEAELTIGGPVTLLQVGHHGSATSSTAALLDQAMPRYAVISSGLPGEGTNRTYCHPRVETVHALTERLGGVGTGRIRAFPSGETCGGVGAEQWIDEPASDHLWATSRDGDVALTTTGNGVFTRE